MPCSCVRAADRPSTTRTCDRRREGDPASAPGVLCSPSRLLGVLSAGFCEHTRQHPVLPASPPAHVEYTICETLYQGGCTTLFRALSPGTRSALRRPQEAHLDP